MTDAAVLPGVLAEIAEVAGHDAALSVALALGGQSIHVPRPDHLGDDHPLAAAGHAAATAVCNRFQGESLYIPKARRALVRHLVARGHGTAQITRLLGLTKQTVRQYARGE